MTTPTETAASSLRDVAARLLVAGELTMAHAVDCNARLVESGGQSPIRSASVAMDRLVRIYGKDAVSTVGTLLSEGAELVRPLVTSEALPVAVVASEMSPRAARYDNSGASCAGARWDRRNLTYV